MFPTRCVRLLAKSKENVLLWCGGDTDNESEDKPTTDDGDEGQITVLMELVGALGLSVRQNVNVDPFCVVRVGDKQLHRSEAIRRDANPIWTVKTKSLCLLELKKRDQDKDSVVTVELRSGSKLLGTVSIPFDKVVDQDGSNRLDFPITPAEGSNINHDATLAVRFRNATNNDRRFMNNLQSRRHSSPSRDLAGLASDINFRRVRRLPFLAKSCYIDRRDRKKRFRVKPYPDPDRPREDTEWMTGDEIRAEALKPSQRWVSAGSGSVGTIYIEIIGCKDLPNLDMSPNDLTDPFVGIVFEDTMLRTDVLWDNLNPRWMPWTTRAFAFHVRHPTSILMLGVFDYDDSPVMSHDPVGRVVVSTAKYESDTTYLLHLRLSHSPREDDTGKRGTLIVRMRIEWSNDAEAARLALAIPPHFIINVGNKKSHQVLRYLTRGSVDMEKASVTSVKLYANELLACGDSVCYFLDVLFEILLWRGRLPLCWGFSVWFPIQSIILFVTVAAAIEYPVHCVPLVLYLLAWIMISVNYHLSRNPNPWKRVKPFVRSKVVAALGPSFRRAVRIEQGKGVAESARLEKLDRIKAARMSRLIQASQNFANNVLLIYSKTSMSSVKITTEIRSWSLLSGRLSNIHAVVMSLCKGVRLFRNFVNWNGYLADSFTVKCLVLATLWLVLPVDRVLLWAVRIVAWTMLSPWMKVLDIIWVHTWYRTKAKILEDLDSGDESVSDLPNFDALLASGVFIQMGHKGRIVAEDAAKLRDMREHMFGDLSESVPAFNSSRFACVPLKESTAEPASVAEPEQVQWYHVPGQKLHGTMILTPDFRDAEPPCANEVGLTR